MSRHATVHEVLAGRAQWALAKGSWEDVLAVDGVEVDAIITDPPYSASTHDNHHVVGNRRAISYEGWNEAKVNAFVDAWIPRCRGWFVCLSDSNLCRFYHDAYRRHGWVGFPPVGVLIPGMTCRLSGDGPSSWMLYANVGRPSRLHKWGTLPGGYTGKPEDQVHIGGKPLWLMEALILDYTKTGDVVCDPCAGGGTTLVAATRNGRRAIGAEVDGETHRVALDHLDRKQAGREVGLFNFGDEYYRGKSG